MKKCDENSVLQIITPDQALPVVFDSPHSGTHYPDDFRYGCALDRLKTIEDAYVDELFEQAPDYQAIFIKALFPRSYIDVNRARNDIDEQLLNDPWPNALYGSIDPSPRSDGGIGLIPRLIRPGTPIYDRKLSANEVMNRIKNYYDPYHDTLCTTLDQAYYNYGHVYHINCHSMPSNSAYQKRPTSLHKRPCDIVLGDKDGQTCERDFIYALRDFWKNLGYHTTINDPFKGVELISAYAQPTRGRSSLQLEINRSLYMDENTGDKNKDFEHIKQHCTDMIKLCAELSKDKKPRIAAD